jgi:hypothetical protein
MAFWHIHGSVYSAFRVLIGSHFSLLFSYELMFFCTLSCTHGKTEAQALAVFLQVSLYCRGAGGRELWYYNFSLQAPHFHPHSTQVEELSATDENISTPTLHMS